jgi:ABC-type microcin C transport system duplicated ATPase subunit YejF
MPIKLYWKARAFKWAYACAACLKMKCGMIRGNQVAMIFQEPMTSLNPVLTCGFQLTEAIRLHLGLSKAEAKQKTIGLFKEVQLPAPKRYLIVTLTKSPEDKNKG